MFFFSFGLNYMGNVFSRLHKFIPYIREKKKNQF